MLTEFFVGTDKQQFANKKLELSMVPDTTPILPLAQSWIRALLERRRDPVRIKNQQFLQESFEFQRDHDTACFYAAGQVLKDYIDPHTPLKSPESVRQSAVTNFRHLNDSEKPLMLTIEHFAQALHEVYGSLGLRLAGYTMNQKADEVIGSQMRQTFDEIPIIQPDYEPLLPDGTPLPYCELMKQAGRDSYHIVTPYPSTLSRSLRQKYEDLMYRTIAIFHFDRKTN